MLQNSFLKTIRNSNVLLTTVRHGGGGGGRPGGKPTFNWKQRKILGLDGAKALKPYKFKPTFQLFSDLEPYFDPKKDVIIDITDLETFEEPQELLDRVAKDDSETENKYEGENNTRKQVQITSLFGSAKPFGLLPNHTRSNRYCGEKLTKRVFPKKKGSTKYGTLVV